MNEDYKTSSIYFKGTKYVKNGKTYKRGFFDKHLKEELKVSPDAIIEVEKFEKNRGLSIAFVSLGLASYVSAQIVDDEDISTGLLIGSGAFVFTSIPFAFKSSNSFQKAIWIRNGTF